MFFHPFIIHVNHREYDDACALFMFMKKITMVTTVCAFDVVNGCEWGMLTFNAMLICAKDVTIILMYWVTYPLLDA